MRSKKASAAVDAAELDAAERVPSRSDSIRPRLRIKLPSDEESPDDSNEPSRRSVDEEKGEEARPKPDAAEKPLEYWRRLRKWLADSGLLPDFGWATKNMEIAKLKPAIRSAVTAWVSLLLVIIPAAERFLGQVSACLINS